VAVFNRRNAAVGWLALFVGKRVLRRKAKHAVASVVGVATFWRRRSKDEETG
jgi:hypothetical protein